MESEVRFSISDQLQALQNVSPEDQEAGMQKIRAAYSVREDGRTQSCTQMEIWDSANKLRVSRHLLSMQCRTLSLLTHRLLYWLVCTAGT